MYQDFKDLLSAFHAHGVKYLIVGGYAVSLYSQPRATKDIDVFIKADPENAKATYAALASFGAPIEGISERDLADPQYFIRFGREPVAVDIMPGIDGVDFDAAWERRVEGVIDESTGATALFIAREDLIAAKMAAGRLRDLADVEELLEAVQSEPPISKYLRSLVPLLRDGRIDSYAAMIEDALADPERRLDAFLTSNDLWGGSGSIADQAGLAAGTREETRREIYRLLILIGNEQMRTGRVNPRTESWVRAFSQWL